MNGDQDTASLPDKVNELERRVASQENELNCLKSSYNALLHRVESLESAKRRKCMHHVLFAAIIRCPVQLGHFPFFIVFGYLFRAFL